MAGVGSSSFTSAGPGPFRTPFSSTSRTSRSVSVSGRYSSVVGYPNTTTNTTTPRSNRTCVETLDTNTVLAIVEGRGQARGEVGMACINLHTSSLILCQFTDTQTYHKVIAKVNIFRPFEVKKASVDVDILMATTCCEGTGVPSQLYLQLQTEVSNVSIVPIQRRIFSEAKGLQRIKQLVVDQYSPVIHLVTQKYYCLSAAAALLKYVELVQSIIFSPKSMKIEFQGSEKTCMIDSVTAQHLELLQNNHQPVSAHSLLGILSNCRTPGGSRLLRMNILQPPCDLKLVQLRLDCVEELRDSREILHGLQDALGRLSVDIEHIIATLIQIPKVDNVRLTEQRINYIIALKHTLEMLPTFLNVLEPTQHDFFRYILEDLKSPGFAVMLDKIQSVLNDEAQVQKGSINMKRQRCFAVKADINPILDIARKAYCEIIDDMNQYVVELSHKLNMPFRLDQNNRRGFFVQLILPGRQDQMPKFPNYFLQVRKQRNVVTFTTEVLLSSDHRSQEISKEIENLSAIVISELTATIRSDIGSLYKISEAIANLDILYALTNYSLTTMRCVRPRFSTAATSITMGRHPVLDSLANCAPVPNNTLLTEDANFAIITGPNMSGKTTYLKQVATLQILAQLGSFVPAEAATFRIASNLFSRIGTGDNLEDNASSFALEMSEMNYILSNVNDNSLIIVDELGRATSVEEGTAISWALAEALLQTKSFVLFATHYLFLTKLESVYRNAVNYTLETQEWVKASHDGDEENNDARSSTNEINRPYNSCKLRYTHVLKRGVTEVEYYGLKLANNSSYPPNVVQRASSIAEAIIDNRKRHNPNNSKEGENQIPTQQLHFLASQLHLASEMADTMEPEDLRRYLASLQQEFLATWAPERLRTSEQLSDMSPNSLDREDESGASLPDSSAENCQDEEVVSQSGAGLSEEVVSQSGAGLSEKDGQESIPISNSSCNDMDEDD